MQYVIHYRNIPTRYILNLFKIYMEPLSDHRAYSLTRKIFRAVKLDISFIAKPGDPVVQKPINQSSRANAVAARSLAHPPAPFTGAPPSKLPGLHPSYPKQLPADFIDLF